MSQHAVDIQNATKVYDELVAVDSVSLSVPRGTTLGLIGPNGAGKTTLLRMICTLAKPDSGDLHIMGKSVSSHPREVRRHLGFMPAEFGSPRNLTIAEYLDYFACLYGVPPSNRKQQISEVCELTDLLGRENIIVNGLSTGNRQRLLLAKTLLHDPDVLVLDEPASGLDPRARTELRAIVKSLASLGKTIIISSHILPDIEDISDQIAIMEAGRLIQGGDLHALRDEYGNAARVLRLRVPSADMERALRLVAELELVVDCRQEDQQIVIDTNAENGNFVLAELLQHDVRVMQFVDDEPNLEEIFLRSTAGRVT